MKLLFLLKITSTQIVKITSNKIFKGFHIDQE